MTNSNDTNKNYSDYHEDEDSNNSSGEGSCLDDNDEKECKPEINALNFCPTASKLCFATSKCSTLV